MSASTAVSCAHAIFCQHVAKFGIPGHISSDRGPQFTSDLWTALNKLLGSEAHRTTSYHLQANGIVERFHRQMKAMLKASLDGSHWMDECLLSCWEFTLHQKRTNNVQWPSSFMVKHLGC